MKEGYNMLFELYGYVNENGTNSKILVENKVKANDIEKVNENNMFKSLSRLPNAKASKNGITHILMKDGEDIVLYTVIAEKKIDRTKITSLDSNYFKGRVEIVNTKRYTTDEPTDKPSLAPVNNTTEYNKTADYSQDGEPYRGNTGKLTTCQEERFLAKHINYYLPLMGLRKIDMSSVSTEQENPLFFLSSFGDSRIYLDMLNCLTDRKLLQYYNTNSYQKTILIRFGFPEFIDLDEHVCGTILEAVYEISHMQGNNFVKNAILKALIGDYINNENKQIRFL